MQVGGGAANGKSRQVRLIAAAGLCGTRSPAAPSSHPRQLSVLQSPVLAHRQAPKQARSPMSLQRLDQVPFDKEKQILVTLDIVSLYTSIPQNPALESMTRALQRRPQPSMVPTDFIIELLEVAMKKNFFIFQNDFFIQSKGVAMGAAFAPDLAILYMDDYEQNCILSSVNPYRDNISDWRRYIDDVVMLWTGDEDQLASFLTWLNAQSMDIKFTMTSSKERMIYVRL